MLKVDDLRIRGSFYAMAFLSVIHFQKTGLVFFGQKPWLKTVSDPNQRKWSVNVRQYFCAIFFPAKESFLAGFCQDYFPFPARTPEQGRTTAPPHLF